jgi:hypothetical protein
MSHNFTIKKISGKWHVAISPSSNYGYFEHDTSGRSGGLWFKAKALTDYDGVFELPREVVKALRSEGYRVASEFVATDAVK